MAHGSHYRFHSALCVFLQRPGDPPAAQRARALHRVQGPRTLDHRSFQTAVGSRPPLTTRTGPSFRGRMSNSKISVGSHRVHQALGMSTMELIRPSMGAVPRIMYASSPV